MVDRGDPTRLVFGPEDGPLIKTDGAPYHKRPSTVYLYQPAPHADADPSSPNGMEFSVMTNEGPTVAPFGSYVAYDEHFGHVWPVAKEYVEQHYAEGAATSADDPDAPATVVEQGQWGARLVADPGYTFETRLDERGPTPQLIIDVVPAGQSNGYVGRHRQGG